MENKKIKKDIKIKNKIKDHKYKIMAGGGIATISALAIAGVAIADQNKEKAEQNKNAADKKIADLKKQAAVRETVITETLSLITSQGQEKITEIESRIKKGAIQFKTVIAKIKKGARVKIDKIKSQIENAEEATKNSLKQKIKEIQEAAALKIKKAEMKAMEAFGILMNQIGKLQSEIKIEKENNNFLKDRLENTKDELNGSMKDVKKLEKVIEKEIEKLKSMFFPNLSIIKKLANQAKEDIIANNEEFDFMDKSHTSQMKKTYIGKNNSERVWEAEKLYEEKDENPLLKTEFLNNDPKILDQVMRIIAFNVSFDTETLKSQKHILRRLKEINHPTYTKATHNYYINKNYAKNKSEKQSKKHNQASEIMYLFENYNENYGPLTLPQKIKYCDLLIEDEKDLEKSIEIYNTKQRYISLIEGYKKEILRILKKWGNIQPTQSNNLNAKLGKELITQIIKEFETNKSKAKSLIRSLVIRDVEVLVNDELATSSGFNKEYLLKLKLKEMKLREKVKTEIKSWLSINSNPLKFKIDPIGRSAGYYINKEYGYNQNQINILVQEVQKPKTKKSFNQINSNFKQEAKVSIRQMLKNSSLKSGSFTARILQSRLKLNNKEFKKLVKEVKAENNQG